MASQKDEKIKEALRELAAEFFSRESNRQSLITVTDVRIMGRGSRAVILVTVLPESEEKGALEFIHRRLTEFREYVMEHVKMMRVPYFDVEIDAGEKNRQRIDEIGRKI